MSNPANLDASVGTYVAVIDDTPAFQGEKVAGYVLGNDPSGINSLEADLGMLMTICSCIKFEMMVYPW